MSTLVYVGANEGNSLWGIFDKFDKVYAFEPNPEVYNILRRRFKQFEWVTLINAACSTEDGETDLYVTPNLVSSSLSDVNTEKYGGDAASRKVTVKTLNLNNYLKEECVDVIDLYYSDCQGSDLLILKTIQEYVDNKKIEQLYIETHGDGVELYKGLDNQFSGFKKVLSDNYKFEHASLGRLNGAIKLESEIPDDELEWDSLWSVKQ
jgi:FkbM family methyltransferase|tara:strand:- start:102 stop:722 length:621 start_codon:yes stop_codon:yes gene_type:complete